MTYQGVLTFFYVIVLMSVLNLFAGRSGGCISQMCSVIAHSYTVILRLVVKLEACRSIALRGLGRKGQLPEIWGGCPFPLSRSSV